MLPSFLPSVLFLLPSLSIIVLTPSFLFGEEREKDFCLFDGYIDPAAKHRYYFVQPSILKKRNIY